MNPRLTSGERYSPVQGIPFPLVMTTHHESVGAQAVRPGQNVAVAYSVGMSSTHLGQAEARVKDGCVPKANRCKQQGP